MTLKKYLSYINKIVKKYPEALKMVVVYAIDDEGNSFHKVPYEPSIGRYEDNEFDGDSSKEHNAICVN